MKNFQIFKLLLVTVVLMCVNFGFAQVVQVPAGCTVVIAGAGGTVGPNPTGFVGNGGVVAMPDPGGGGQFNFSIAGTATTASWSLRGDISSTNVTPNSAPVQAPAGTFANIFTCNKNIRTSETLAPSLSSWARSKGQVRLLFSLSGCSGQTMAFDIFKSFTTAPLTNVPAIVGPSCLKPKTVYTYSVDPIVSDNINDAIGVDSYYWSGIPATYLTPGTDFYTSADGSSITFKTGSSVTPITLICGYGRVNPTANNVDGGVSTFTNATGSHSTSVTKALTIAPLQPSFSAIAFLNTMTTMNATVNPSACLATGQNTFTLTYPNPAVGQIYTWTAPNTGWTLNTAAGPGDTILSGNTNGNNNPATITLTITGNSCDPVVFNYQINRNLTAPLQVIATGINGNCINATSSGVNTYTISPSAVGIPVSWSTVPAVISGVTLSNATTNTVTVNTAGAALGTSFTLQAQTAGSVSPCNTSISTIINVRAAVPTIVSGATCVAKGGLTSQTYTCSASGASYIWSFPAGWTAGSFTTINPTITVTPANATAVLNGGITVTALGTNGCNSTASSALYINYLAVPPTLTSATCTSVGSTSGFITVTNIQNYGYYNVSSVPAGILSSGIITGSTNLGLIIPSTLAAGTYSITVTHNNTNPCGIASTTLANVIVSASTAAWATGFPSYDNTAGGSDV